MRVNRYQRSGIGKRWAARIVAGAPHKPAAFHNWRVKATQEQIARSLEGNWQEDLLFALKQKQDGYEFCHKQMAKCDRQLEQYLRQREDRSQGASLPEEKRKERLKKKKGNAPQFDLRTELFRITGTDLTPIDGIMTATTILSEAGWEMSKWQTEHHFVSWLRLCLGSGKGRAADRQGHGGQASWQVKAPFLEKGRNEPDPRRATELHYHCSMNARE